MSLPVHMSSEKKPSPKNNYTIVFSLLKWFHQTFNTRCLLLDFIKPLLAVSHILHVSIE